MRETGLAFLALFSIFLTSFAHASVLPGPPLAPGSIELEGFLAWQGRNDVAVPGNTGTRFSLKEVIQSPNAGVRGEFSYTLSEKSQLRGVIAPLSLGGTGKLARDVTFQGASFITTQPTEAEYRFNSYRLTYRYAFFMSGPWTLMGGLTAKIRDARVALKQGAISREKTDVGFVPLLYAASGWHFAPNWQAEAELDALVVPQGRAEDLSIRLRRSLTTLGWSTSLGYRILEGGASNDEVFTYALFHYLTVSVAYEF